MHTDPLTAYTDGELSPLQTARAILSELREIDSELAPHLERKEELRAVLTVLVMAHGTQESDAGTARWIAPTTGSAYDAKRLDTLMADLLVRGYVEVAQEIAACKKPTSRAGYVKIERGKE